MSKTLFVTQPHAEHRVELVDIGATGTYKDRIYAIVNQRNQTIGFTGEELESLCKWFLTWERE